MSEWGQGNLSILGCFDGFDSVGGGQDSHYEESDRLKLPYPAEGRLKDFKVRLNPPGRSWTKAIQGCILAYGHSRQALCEALRAFCDDVLRKTGMQLRSEYIQVECDDEPSRM